MTAHGSMISTLSKQGSGGYAYSALRMFDAWGAVRRGAQTGDPKGRYCASLGHKQDDESSLTFMRARYYEQSSGRFLSEDPKVQGLNWFSYCGNDPVSNSDFDGKSYGGYLQNFLSAILLILLGCAMSRLGAAVAVMDLLFMLDWQLGPRMAGTPYQVYDLNARIGTTIGGALAMVADMAFKPADMSPTSAILGLCLEHDGFLLAFLALMDCENEDQVD
jgi:RHS repeat-associated protein